MTKKSLRTVAGCFMFLCLSQSAFAQVTASLVYNSGPLCGTPAVPCYSGSQTQSFTFRIVNGNTASYPIMSVIIAPPSDLNMDACYFLYGPWGNSGRGTVALFGDSPQESNNNPWWRGWQEGTDISNSQCTVKGSTMTKTASGNDLIVTIPIVASSLMIGTYNIFISTGSWNFSAPNGYWQPIATLPPPPTTSVLPGSGTGMNATFDVTISSSGVGKSRALNRSLFFVNQYFSGAGGCYLIYQNTNRQLIMLADDGNNTIGLRLLGTTPGASQIASNTQCTMDLGQITYADPGTNDVTLHIPVAAFTETFGPPGQRRRGCIRYRLIARGKGLRIG